MKDTIVTDGHVDVEQLKKYARDLIALYTSEKEKIKALHAAQQQLERYADDLAITYESLRNSERRYRALFEDSPISLWEADLSPFKNYIDAVRNKGVEDFRAYFNEHPEEVARCADMIKIVDVNRATLGLYQATSKEALIGNTQQVLAEHADEILAEELIGIAEKGTFEVECVTMTLLGKKITVLINGAIPPGYEKTWSKVFISVQDLTERARVAFLKDIFGRYMAEDVMNMLLENPDLVRLGGEKRNVTIMMSDIRGFTPLSERLDPEKVLEMLNTYFEVMVEIILKYNATINEIIGDSILVIFGAPQQMVDRCQRAVACAIEMQNAMREVNSQNQARGLPPFEIGIGLNESEVIVGNIGSKKRTKYGVVGSGVNLASRIESFTVGGQILISDSVYNEIGNLLLINHQMKVHPKGSKKPLTVYEVSGISGQYNLSLKNGISNPVALEREIPVYYVPLEENHPSERKCSGALLQLSRHSAVMRLQLDHDLFTNLKFNLSEAAKELSCKDFYGKVVGISDTNCGIYTVRFTSLPPAVGDYFQAVTDRS
jgi:class 3 adenylate cyclase/PAS domain-containing protein